MAFTLTIRFTLQTLRHKNSTRKSAFCFVERDSAAFVPQATLLPNSSLHAPFCVQARPLRCWANLFFSNHARTSLREKGKSKHAQHGRIALGGRRPAEQRDVRCQATTYIFFSAISE